MKIPRIDWDELNAVATGTAANRFRDDLSASEEAIADVVLGKQVLVIGGAGSIGAGVVDSLCGFKPRELVVVDHDENGLTELIRRLRSKPAGHDLPVTALPLDFGREPMARMLRDHVAFDLVLNFAALKHVRSEKDVYSVLQMIDTNVLAQSRLLTWLSGSHAPSRYFAVSTDKAAEPVSFMGASKRLMEAVIFTGSPQETMVTSARFANVAFSAGSLLESVVNRLSRDELVACPAGTRRFFISVAEATALCMVGFAATPRAHLLIPALDPEREMPLVSDIVVRILAAFGLDARFFDDESEARAALAGKGDGAWRPVLLTSGQTEGEKPYERFHDAGEAPVGIGLQRMLAVPYTGPTATAVDRLVAVMSLATADVDVPVTREDVERWVGEAVPRFRHAHGTGKLDAGV